MTTGRRVWGAAVAAASAIGTIAACLGPDPSILPFSGDASVPGDGAPRDAGSPPTDSGDCGCDAGKACYAGVCGGAEVQAVAAGHAFSCALLAAGEVWCWGSNAQGRLGTGAKEVSHPAPLRVTGLSAIDEISVGDDFACAHRRTDRAVLCWGRNANLQLGHDPTAFRDNAGPFNAKPIAVQGLPPVMAVEVGASFACAWDDKRTYCWGANDKGQLDTPASAPAATTLTPLGAVKTVTLGIDPTSPNGCAVRMDGSVICWGDNDFSQRGVDAGTGSPASPINAFKNPDSLGSGSGVNCVVNASSVLACAGTNRDGELGVKKIAASATFIGADFGPLHALSLRSHTACAIG